MQQLPPWVVKTGQQATWNAANPATQRDWQKNPNWRPTPQANLFQGSLAASAAPWSLSSGAVPGLGSLQRDPFSSRTIRNDFTDAVAELGRGLAPGVVPGSPVVSETPEQAAARMLRQSTTYVRDPSRPGILTRNLNIGTPPGNGASYQVTPQAPWFQNPWGAASKSREVPYYMGAYGRG